MVQVFDRVKETSATSGFSDIVLAGAATDYQSFSSSVSSGNPTFYCVELPNSNQWEVGQGTLTSGNVILRSQILSSSSGGNLVNFSSGTKNVFLPMPASKAVHTGTTYSDPSWITSLNETKVLPSQTANSGKYLTTNGTSSSWGTVSIPVTSVSNSDGTLTISPTTGAVVASLALSHANTWTGLQTFTATSDSTKGVVVKAFSGTQSADLQQWQDSSGTVLTKITKDGSIDLPINSSTLASIGNSAFGANKITFMNTGAITVLTPQSPTSFNSSYSSSTGQQVCLNITPTIAQSSTAGMRCLVIDPTVSTTGSGPTYLIEALRGGSTRFSLDLNGAAVLTLGNALSVGLTVKGAPSQLVNLQEWKDSSDNQLLAVNSQATFGVLGMNLDTGTGIGVDASSNNGTGTFLRFTSSSSAGRILNCNGNFSSQLATIDLTSTGLTFGNGTFKFLSSASNITPLVVKATGTPTVDTFQVQDSSGTAILGVYPELFVFNKTAQAVTSHIADFRFLGVTVATVYSSGTVSGTALESTNVNGLCLNIGSSQALIYSTGNSNPVEVRTLNELKFLPGALGGSGTRTISVISQDSGQIPFVVKGASSQSVALFAVQDSSSNNLFKITPNQTDPVGGGNNGVIIDFDATGTYQTSLRWNSSNYLESYSSQFYLTCAGVRHILSSSAFNFRAGSAGDFTLRGDDGSNAKVNMILQGSDNTGAAGGDCTVRGGDGGTTSSFFAPGSLTLRSGNARGGTDTAGTNTTIASGVGTGAAAAGNIILQTSPALASGTTAQTLVTREVTVAKGKALTDATATSLFEIALPTLKMCGGEITATVNCTDGTDMQAFTQKVTFSAANKGGSYTTNITADSNNDSKSVSSGTIANTWSILNGTNKITVQLSSDTSLTPSGTNSFVVYYSVKLNTEQAITIL